MTHFDYCSIYRRVFKTKAKQIWQASLFFLKQYYQSFFTYVCDTEINLPSLPTNTKWSTRIIFIWQSNYPTALKFVVFCSAFIYLYYIILSYRRKKSWAVFSHLKIFLWDKNFIFFYLKITLSFSNFFFLSTYYNNNPNNDFELLLEPSWKKKDFINNCKWQRHKWQRI